MKAYHEAKRFLVEEPEEVPQGEQPAKETMDDAQREYERVMDAMSKAATGMRSLSSKSADIIKHETDGGMAMDAPVDIPRIIIATTKEVEKAQQKVQELGELMSYLDKARGGTRK